MQASLIHDGAHSVTSRLMVVALAVGVLACVAGLSPVRAAAAAAFSSAVPAADTTVPGSPARVSVYVDDASKILTTSEMVVNGENVPVAVDWPGHIEDPDCEAYWVVDDWTAATISYTAPEPLPEGSYDVTVTVRTESSGTSSFSWSFAIDYPPGSAATFWSRYPAPDSTVTAPVQLRTMIGSPNGALSPGNAAFFLDGVRQTSWASMAGGGSLSAYTPMISTTDGPHVVRATVVDSIGVYTQTSWGFTTAVPPTLSDPVPSGGASYVGLRPQIGLTIADNTPGSLGVRLVLDGTEVFDGMVPQGQWRWTPTFDLASGVSHEAQVHVTDAAGNTSVLSWGFSDLQFFSGYSPAIDSTLTGTPTQAGLYIDASSRILETSQVSIDGVAVATRVDWVGHWEGDDCESWWVVDDYTAATISASTGVLRAGVHTVTVEAHTESEGALTRTWTFAIVYEPGSEASFSGFVPSAGATVTAVFAPQVVATSINTLSWDRASLSLDGVPIPKAAAPYTGSRITLYGSPAPGWTDGPHTLYASFLDNKGVFSETQWSFNVQIPPALGDVVPGNSSSVSVPRPRIGLRVYDNTPGTLRLRLKLDGAIVRDEQVAQGYAYWTPSGDLAPSGSHTVVADVWDAAGNISSSTWTFNVAAAPAMSDSASCTSCHSTFPGTHPFNECAGCHADDPLYDPHGPNRYAPLGPCFDCHGGSYAHSGTSVSDCVSCHRSAEWTQIPRHDAVPSADHLSSSTGCVACHSRDLIAEHALRSPAPGFNFQCATCHTSSDPDVSGAIRSGQTACFACHRYDIHPHAPAALEGIEASGHACSGCHSADVFTEHAKATSTSHGDPCEACHRAGGSVAALGGVWDGSCTTAECHGPATDRPYHDNLCLACHGVSAAADFAGGNAADFAAVPAVVRSTACPACHIPAFAGSHPNHYAGGDCGAVCHRGWGASILTARANITTAWGAFNTVSSASSDAETLHAIHSQARWPAGVTRPTSACPSCHSVVACEACHAGSAASSSHASHGATPSAEATSAHVWPGTVCTGVTEADQTRESARADTSLCGATECHGAYRAPDAPPALREAHSHAAIGSIPANTVVRTGTWKEISSSSYTMSRASYSALANSTLSIDFVGTKVAVVTDAGPSRGLAVVAIDGVDVATIDCYAATGRSQVTAFTSGPLAYGAHRVTVRVLGQRTAPSTAATVVLDQFKVWTKPPPKILPTCEGCHAARAAVHY